MAVTSSQIRIINGAFAELGSTKRITSIDDTLSGQARTAKSLWDEILASELEVHPWNFAIRRASIDKSGAAPINGYDFQYPLPADCIRWLPWDDAEPEHFKGEEEGGKILSNAETPLQVRYISYADNVPMWKPSFVRLMTLAMATSMAEAVTQKQSIKDRMENRMIAARRTAKRLDGLATGKRKRSGITKRSDWNRARNIPHFHVGR